MLVIFRMNEGHLTPMVRVFIVTTTIYTAARERNSQILTPDNM